MSYRDRRSPDRGRERYPPPPPVPIDSYIPPTSSRATRARSRSPAGARGRSRTPPRPTADTWRGRPSSPKRYEPRADSYSSRDARPRSPRRDYVPTDSRYNDGPRNTRDRPSPPLKRERDPSPYARNGRSPPPAKKERISSPTRDYARARSPSRRTYSPPRDSKPSHRPRSRSPRREERVDPYAVKSWRRQSRSPRGDSGRNSGANSRRSSPRSYTRKPTESVAAEDTRYAPNSSYRSPARRDPIPERTRSPYRDTPDDSRVKPSSDRDNGFRDSSYTPRDATAAGYRERPPPTGPASSHREGAGSLLSPPTGPTASPYSMSAHSRGGPISSLAYPRGGFGSYRGRGGPPSRDYPPSRREKSSWGGAVPYGRGGGPRDPYPPRDPAAPSLPRRESGYGAIGGSSTAAFRGSSNSTSLTYPRTQRFNQATSGIPEIKPGGEKLPPLHDTTKADKLEEEAAKLRKAIDEKEIKKRQGLREWEKLEKESSNASLRSELAEDHLRSLNGEGEGMAAAF